MLQQVGSVAREQDKGALKDALSVCRRIPPLWDLQNYVAVNPFLGFAETPMSLAAQMIQDGLGARVYPTLTYYRSQWSQGKFGSVHLDAALTRSEGGKLNDFVEILEGRQKMPFRESSELSTVAAWHDETYGTDWSDQLTRFITRWCAVYATRGGPSWSNPCGESGLYASWIDAAQNDWSLEIAGLSGWRTFIAELPHEANLVFESVLTRLPFSAAQRKPYLYRLLREVYGWAAYFRKLAWHDELAATSELIDLLAIRICAEVAISELGRGSFPVIPPKSVVMVEDESVLAVLQDALETAYASSVITRIVGKPLRPRPTQPELQAVFCIDVRSEPFRRHLEAQSGAIETLGFAGFFGLPFSWDESGHQTARCPVLLKPGLSIKSDEKSLVGDRATELRKLQAAPAAAFSLVELMGWVYGLRLGSDSLGVPTKMPVRDGRHGFAIKAGELTNSALSIIKNMGLRAPFARLVLLCGHESENVNNAHTRGLDCGACGGHSGAINARLVVRLLNEETVREYLRKQGLTIPAETRFIAGIHNTTTDEVTVLDINGIPDSHQADLQRLMSWLESTAKAVREEKIHGPGVKANGAEVIADTARKRARDWSEPRPEWGLARNAAFIAARRGLTKGLDLEARTFLHEYDAKTDEDLSILTLILSAPMVVASWINLQYFASTVDNSFFGCGSKALHNRVGELGVVLGNGGDLRTGLPLQSVHTSDGTWYHEPVRLQVIVEARSDRIETVLAEQPAVKQLVDQGWLCLFSIDPDNGFVTRRIPQQGWEAAEMCGIQNVPHMARRESL